MVRFPGAALLTAAALAAPATLERAEGQGGTIDPKILVQKLDDARFAVREPAFQALRGSLKSWSEKNDGPSPIFPHIVANPEWSLEGHRRVELLHREAKEGEGAALWRGQRFTVPDTWVKSRAVPLRILVDAINLQYDETLSIPHSSMLTMDHLAGPAAALDGLLYWELLDRIRECSKASLEFKANPHDDTSALQPSFTSPPRWSVRGSLLGEARETMGMLSLTFHSERRLPLGNVEIMSVDCSRDGEAMEPLPEPAALAILRYLYQIHDPIAFQLPQNAKKSLRVTVTARFTGFRLSDPIAIASPKIEQEFSFPAGTFTFYGAWKDSANPGWSLMQYAVAPGGDKQRPSASHGAAVRMKVFNRKDERIRGYTGERAPFKHVIRNPWFQEDVARVIAQTPAETLAKEETFTWEIPVKK